MLSGLRWWSMPFRGVVVRTWSLPREVPHRLHHDGDRRVNSHLRVVPFTLTCLRPRLSPIRRVERVMMLSLLLWWPSKRFQMPRRRTVNCLLRTGGIYDLRRRVYNISCCTNRRIRIAKLARERKFSRCVHGLGVSLISRFGGEKWSHATM